MTSKKYQYKLIRKEQAELSGHIKTLERANQVGKYISNYDLKIKTLQMAIEEKDIEAAIIRQELVEESKANRTIYEAEQKVKALQRKEENRRKLHVDTPFATQLAGIKLNA